MSPFIWKAELAVDSRCELGEGPQWHAAQNRLYWCDILGKRLHWLDPATARHESVTLDQMVSCAAPVSDGRLLLVGERSLALFDTERQTHTHLCAFEADNPVTRSNDARVDRHGGLWLSTMGKNAEPKAGSLYRLYRGELVILRTGLTIPNSICFSADDHAYFTDTPTGQVMRWALDENGWPVGEPECFADFSTHAGSPDGAVMDSEGCLWLSLWGAGEVVRLDEKGQIIGRVALPVDQPSCPVFAGDDLKTLYITTAREGLSSEKLAETPTAGALYRVETGVAGLAEPPLQLA
ncbi:SMP-30/gluconolactonase/LRE family protein [Halomonas aquamarina]|uniref:SMP-30/gluconolactonase/LRE family protein n=1 Tax=Vreelandella aquamarina TaxID=77097 RepID=A0ACC5VYQ0_9GAMM|nr:SMP-30/gluconolactonase/LRE family protein [Halomonas aquamarina]MBZ5489014.1 SMP-30/gluconolactonase/LRE family protein [Halomonas aquamarina]